MQFSLTSLTFCNLFIKTLVWSFSICELNICRMIFYCAFSKTLSPHSEQIFAISMLGSVTVMCFGGWSLVQKKYQKKKRKVTLLLCFLVLDSPDESWSKVIPDV